MIVDTLTLRRQILDDYTFLKPCRVESAPDAHTVWFKVGGQSFCVTSTACDTKEEAEWMRAQLAGALSNLVEKMRIPIASEMNL